MVVALTSNTPSQACRSSRQFGRTALREISSSPPRTDFANRNRHADPRRLSARLDAADEFRRALIGPLWVQVGGREPADRPCRSSPRHVQYPIRPGAIAGLLVTWLTMGGMGCQCFRSCPKPAIRWPHPHRSPLSHRFRGRGARPFFWTNGSKARHVGVRPAERSIFFLLLQL